MSDLQIKTEDNPTETRKLARRLRRLADSILEESYELSVAQQSELVEQLRSIEKLLKPSHPKESSGKRRPRVAAVLGELGKLHTEVLTWISEKRFASTSQIRDYRGIGNATDILRELEKAGLLDSGRYELHLGRQSEKVYWLSSRGANYLNNHNIGARYESRFASRPPDMGMVHFRTMEYEVPKQAHLAGWRIVEPQVFNSVNPKGKEQTRQATILANALQNIEQAQIEETRHSSGYAQLTQRISDFNLGKHLKCIPHQCNEHVAYVPKTNIVLVFILCPLEISPAFWQSKIAQYESLAKRASVFGVFWHKEQASAWQARINDSDVGAIYIGNTAQVFADYSPG